MLKKSVATHVFAAVFAAAGALGTATTAQAVVFGLEFDPSFGGSFGDLGFRGYAEVFIPDACLQSTGYTFNSDACSNGAMQMLSASVDLYRFAGLNPPVEPPTITSAVFTAAQLLDQVIGANIQFDPDANRIDMVGLDTFLIGEQIVDVTDGQGTIYQGPIWLFFESGVLNDPAFIRLGTCTESGCTPDQTSDPAVVRIFRVPEPGTLGLLLGACGAGWLARRRARQVG
jgi:hypothetical protein